ncbi:MAG: hypothetical protein LIO62_04335 [Clostridiales bacterium]|nr:hypothetical protein [Clostridiales bacterium]
MENSKKNKLTSAIAVGLAAVMLIGGASYAYLEDSDGDVVNNFSTNKVEVDIDETTGEDYDIVPGTSQDKDPTVTIDNTVDSYLYVIIEDNTQDLVEWAIADGWTLLDGYDNVYYRLVGADDADKTFSVLDGDQVSYSADLTNADMEAADGDVTLTFKAYAIQAEPFNDPVKAYTQESVSTVSELLSALSAGHSVTLADDLEIDDLYFYYMFYYADDGALINLNGNTITVDDAYYGAQIGSNTDPKSVTVSNGTIEYTGFPYTSWAAFGVYNGSSLTLDNITAVTDGSFVSVSGDSSTVNITNSDITASGYAIATNAGSSSNYGVVINVDDSTLYGDGAGICMNVPGTVNVTDSTVTGGRQAVILRAGTANISDSTLANTIIDEDDWAIYDNKNWGSGNSVAVSVITIGNRNGSYAGDAVANLSNVTCEYDDSAASSKGVYLYGGVTYPTTNAEPNTATLNYDSACNLGTIVQGETDYSSVNLTD